jgi:YHS domain-containing protein
METTPVLMKDVVCGMMVDPKTAPARSEYRGTAYSFCAKGCRVAFDKDPGRFIAGQANAPLK